MSTNILSGKIFTLLNTKQAECLFNRVKRDAIQLVRSIYRANKAKDKVIYLETFKKQAELSGLMDSIGKQITGWRNANR